MGSSRVGQQYHLKWAKMSKGSQVFQNLNGYCAKTTIHGFSYLADRFLHPIGKLFWAVVIVLGIRYEIIAKNVTFSSTMTIICPGFASVKDCALLWVLHYSTFSFSIYLILPKVREWQGNPSESLPAVFDPIEKGYEVRQSPKVNTCKKNQFMFPGSHDCALQRRPALWCLGTAEAPPKSNSVLVWRNARGSWGVGWLWIWRLDKLR